ncbi:MAG: FAD/NAD(P)-binding protein [Sedimentitalea sp.]|uniref:FAD/NAD(P)-binding protein n=1 Tax=Sedimentitalea sp. TaxID=2048915 RepID=UPI0032675C26
MTDHVYDRTLAIVGLGPRGLGALEALAADAIDRKFSVKVDIFDATNALGAGPNFHPDESALCLLNIPVRVLDIDPPRIVRDEIAPFAKWSSANYNPDDFPPRCDLGAYLMARFKALCDVTKAFFDTSHSDVNVSAVRQNDNGWWVSTADKQLGPYDEVLLCPGQPATEPDPQLQRWMDHAQKNALNLVSAYPAKSLLSAAHDWRDKQVAVRGLGLSTHDVLRILTLGLSGRFEDGSYVRSGNEPRKILPFSRDGLPPAPKPATAEIDALYDPLPKEVTLFETSLAEAVTQPPKQVLKTVCDALIMPTARILASLGVPHSLATIERWLAMEREDPGTQDSQETSVILRTTIEMAHNRVPPSVGYVVGQLWRKLQNELRSGVNSAELSSDAATALVGFDEALKRYSYGPPVSASEQLLILIDDGLVGLQAVDDPDIMLDPDGWRLVEGDDALSTQVMVDAVLPSPDLEQIIDPLIRCAVEGGLITPVDDGFGAQTLPDGTLVNRNGDSNNGLCLLGRLSLGSVIAADSLHDCFGASTHRWAKGFVARGLAARPSQSQNE